ncbi:MAG TPA: hypothetical protein VFC99_10510, partial [Acidimicrobiia bacterium]|nr:hypothetical protein [Acidimicrobiia bacterium]
GVHHSPFFIQKIVGPDGNTLFEQTPQGDRVLPQDVADCEINLLHGVIENGTGTGAQLANGRAAFGKTGTTENKANAAFYGGTPGQLVAFVWYGDKDTNVPGAGFGGEKPASMWKAFMDAQLAAAPEVQLPPAGPVCARPGATITDTGRDANTPAQSDSNTGAQNPPPTVRVNPPAPAPKPPPAPRPAAPRPNGRGRRGG